MTTPRPELCREDFSYELPEQLIAQEPEGQRDQSRLLVRMMDGALEHREFSDLPKVLPPKSLIVFNDSMVIPSRLRATVESGKRVEVFLLEREQGHQWRALGRPLRALERGTRIQFDGGVVGTVTEPAPKGSVAPFAIEFAKSGVENFDRWLEETGQVPLPPYIHRSDPEPFVSSRDRETYQTVYAKHRGSAAAPTAGLHFSQDLMARLIAAGHELAFVTLHVGAATFLPVRSSKLEEHPMHSERYALSRPTYQSIQQAMDQGRAIVAVGTTTLRCLEAFHRDFGENPDEFLGRWQRTSLFLYPRHRRERIRPWAVDALITNFHQPESTLFMLICALLGMDQAHALYGEAKMAEYRFLSYGDGSLLWLPC